MTCAPGVDCWEELKRIQAERAEQVRSHYEGKKEPLTPGEVPVESAVVVAEAVEAPIEVVVEVEAVADPVVEAPVEEKKAPKAKKKDAPVGD